MFLRSSGHGREFALLALLLQEPGRIYGRQEVIETLWPQGASPLASHLVDTHLANLRAKLRSAGAHRLIRTVRGYGFSVRVEGASNRLTP
ncbi:winged helix-turn-helix domain-containing protein [Deinococcus ruber]|uniref:winged helix-turn-helix domain-containing protein n=1 Tax=Deinococcus ruber TaxID=1848197 RepID=UPI00166CA41B|nr:winged helix-turn-helix domain-containing protein [Deinococcus ruber]